MVGWFAVVELIDVAVTAEMNYVVAAPAPNALSGLVILFPLYFLVL